jgi:glucose/arabinose dehydrogenase
MKNLFFYTSIIAVVIFSLPALSVAQTSVRPVIKVADENGGLKLPAKFKATILAQNIGNARHIVVTPQGGIYVKLAKPVNKKGILFLQESNGKAVVKSGFGNYEGTGIYIKEGYLYSSSNEEVFRYKLNSNNEVINPDAPEKIVTGLISRWQHESKSLVLDNDGNLYVNIGAYLNSCQEKDRQKGSMGIKGCPVLDSAGGIWMFKADKLNQSYGDGVRYATGLRNVVGLDWNQQDNQLFVMQHGRDQLHDIFPDLYTVQQSALNPAECMFALKKATMQGGLTCITIYRNIKICWHRNMAAMGKRKQINNTLTLLRHTLPTWLPTDCFFIRVASFLQNIKTELL